MSLYIDFPVGGLDSDNAGGSERREEFLCSAWCKSDQIVAVSIKERGVAFYSEEGDAIGEDSELVRSGSDALCLDWRVDSKVLASGWEDGAVVLWNVKDKSLKEDTSAHSSKVNLLSWSPEGGRLLSGDSSGVVAVWRTDYRGRLAVACKRDLGKGERIECCEWMLTPEYREAQRELSSPPSFVFVSTQFGSLFLLNLAGEIVASTRIGGGIRTLNWFEEEQKLVVVSDDNALTLLSCPNCSSLEQVKQVRLSLSSSAHTAGVSGACWTSPGLLALCTEEGFVRFWDIANDQSYFISSAESSSGDVMTCICFNAGTRLLAASSRSGKIFLWRFVGASWSKEESTWPSSSPASWESVATLSALQGASSIRWGPRENSLCVLMDNKCSIMNETVLHRTLRNDVAAVQVAAQRLLVQRGASSRIETPVGLRIKGLDVNDTHVLVWNHKKAEVYEFTETEQMKKVSSFPCHAESMALYGETLFFSLSGNLEVTNLHGVSRKTIVFSPEQGEPKMLHVSGKFLSVATSKGLIQVYDVSKREPRFCAQRETTSFGIIRSLKANCDGTRVSFRTDMERGHVMCEPDTRIHVWNVDRDQVDSFDFEKRFPISHFWDNEEPKLLVCEAKRKPSQPVAEAKKLSSSENALKGSRLRYVATGEEEKKDSTSAAAVEDKENSQKDNAERQRLLKINMSRLAKTEDSAEVQVVTLFATDSNLGVLMQDSFALEPGMDALLGLKVPRLLFIQKSEMRLKGKTMRDFVGLELNKMTDEMKRALLDFSYYLTIGNMDDAYRSVKLIDNVSVWENMAHMCVKTHRLDVAEMCFGNMGHARGAAALRLVSQGSFEERAAMVAIQLGLLDDAERVYIRAGRYDLLNKMLCASGQWDKALEVANGFDRLHLRESHFELGRHLESMHDYKAAIANYEASQTHRKQVPRMLFAADRLDELEAYIQAQCDESLTRWWGQYQESLGNLSQALHIYQKSGDDLSAVRVHCYMNNVQEACQIALTSANPAASYHLARNCELRGDIQEAIQFYARAGRYNHAVRLAREFGMDSDIVNLALRGSKKVMLEAAAYLETRGFNEDAVVLYQKAGNVAKALDLCFHAQLFLQLANITDTMVIQQEDAQNKEILVRCAEFFIEHGKYDKAAKLYITAGDFETALELCYNQKVTVTEEMAETMTLEKSDKSEARRQSLLESIAKCCKKQGSFHLAAKKYTQAGDRLKAMKCLLRAGSTDKIIFFAGVSRSREIYILAANYLQNMDWRNDPEIMKSIISFYTKAKAFQQLSAFYQACAQFEIDEYKDYAKALAALNEATKYMTKVQSEEKQEMLVSLQQKSMLVERFVQAQAAVRDDPQQAERTCTSLISNEDTCNVLRLGDVYALLVDIYVAGKDYEQAVACIEKMKARQVAVSPYITQDLLRDIYRHAGVEYDQPRGGKTKQRAVKSPTSPIQSDYESGDEVEEELELHK